MYSTERQFKLHVSILLHHIFIYANKQPFRQQFKFVILQELLRSILRDTSVLMHKIQALATTKVTKENIHVQAAIFWCNFDTERWQLGLTYAQSHVNFSCCMQGTNDIHY